MTPQSRARAKLLLLAALFFAPVIGAISIFFYAPDWFGGRVNYGTLVSPARPVPDLGIVEPTGAPAPEALKHKWTLVYLARAACDEACHARLLLTRQVRLALNQNRGRVQRVYLAPGLAAAAAAKEQLAPEHPDLVILSAGSAPRDFFQPVDPDAVYLLDPLGNWLMVYAGAIEHRGLHRDLKKLLRVSRVG